MKERQIPFNGPMVRAVLDGSKTQTRRVVKLPHQNPLGSWEPFDWGGPNGGRTAQGETVPLQQVIAHTRTGEIISCPYGQPGDQLWVREAWKAHPTFDHLPPRDIPPNHVWYMADDGYKAESRYRQGMFMPRWASRIRLEIVSVRLHLDIAKLQVETGVPYVPFNTVKGQSKWEPLFAKLTAAGQSVPLPGHMKGALAAAILLRNKQKNGTFRIAMTSANEARIWRTA